MNLAIFSPLGRLQRETGLIYLLSHYIRGALPEAVQLRCNGIFSLCGRDSENHWSRSLNTCLSCKKESAQISEWGAFQPKDLSSYLKADEVEQTKRWISAQDARQLMRLEYKGAKLFELCAHSLSARLGVQKPDLTNKRQEDLARRHVLSTLRMWMAAKRFLGVERPELSFVAGGKDFMSACYLATARQQGCPVALFVWDEAQKIIFIHHPQSDQVFPCELYLDDVVSRRADIKTWPAQLTERLDAIKAFLNIDDTQLPLPLAR